MTDVEMAEAYVTKNAKHILDTNNAFVSAHEAYLAGLKAGGPEWHDLRKDLKDLPNGHRAILNQAGEITIGEPICANYSLQYKINELEQGNEALKIRNSELAGQTASLNRWLGEAKQMIKTLLNVFVEDLAEEDLDVGQIDVREKVYRFLEDCK